MEVAAELPVDLFVSKLIQPSRITWCCSNEAVNLSFSWRWSGSLLDRFQVYQNNG